MLNSQLDVIAKITKRKYYVNMFITTDGTKYGITRINKDKTQEIVITTEHNKRELYGLMTGFLLLRKEQEGLR